MSTFCPQCGWDVEVDEAGTCKTCGALAMGIPVELMALDRKMLGEYQRIMPHVYPPWWWRPPQLFVTFAMLKLLSHATEKVKGVIGQCLDQKS